jgi:hypothetical protein
MSMAEAFILMFVDEFTEVTELSLDLRQAQAIALMINIHLALIGSTFIFTNAD